MKKCVVSFFLMALSVITFNSYGAENEYAKYVDPYIGTEGDGNVFPGVCAPLGMVKLGPDCGDKNANPGYHSQGNIHGFSHIHVSGTGGGCKYGNVLFLPMTGEINLQDYSSPRTNEKTEVGLFEVGLSRYDTYARMTASYKSAMHEYTFPKSDASKIIIDAGSFLSSNLPPFLAHENQYLVGSEVRIISDTEIEGYTRVRGGWNSGTAYTVYFYARFDTPAAGFGTWKEDKIYEGQKEQYDSGQKTGAFFKYKTKANQKINVKVGISYLGTLKAKANLEQEIASKNFEQVKDDCVAEWNRLLSKIDITGSEDQKKIFYTALYHSYLQPTDKTGENVKWQSDEPYFDDFYAIWDTFRATHPLMTILTPTLQTNIMRSLIDIYKHDKYMPDARSGDCNGIVQGGSNCDILIADAFVKGLKLDYETALESMIKNAETPPGDDERKEGRGGIADYNTLGYVSTDYERAGSRTMEYGNCDYAIYTVANGLGKTDIAEKYLQRSHNWENIWNMDIESLGFNGFVWPRNPDGSWASEEDFNLFKGGTWPDFLYETFSWEISFYAPHDMPNMIKKCGGTENFTKRLDTYFSYDKVFDQRWNIGLFQISNEPGFLIPNLYNYVGRPDRVAEIVRKILVEKYKSTRAGLPGNDDSGSMSAWYVFQALGFYPNAGQDLYLISSPTFANATIHLENGKQVKIIAQNTGKENIYIQSLKINGKEWDKNYFRHSDIANGATLEFVMGSTPSSWGQKPI